MSSRFPVSRRCAMVAVASCVASLTARAAPSVKTRHAAALEAFDSLLARYVIEGRDGVNRVAYRSWIANEADRSMLRDFIATQSTLNPVTMPASEAFASWANLYNALTLEVVLTAYPVTSIRDIKSRGAGLDLKALFGPWRTKLVTVAGQQLSLDDIEHEIMRPTFRDPRVHYAVNCAAMGCPNLWPRAWRANTLSRDLDRAAQAYINHPRGVRVQPNGALAISSIYKWYTEDFGGTDAAIVAHLRRYAPPELAARIKPTARIASDHYDWSLNDRRGQVAR